MLYAAYGSNLHPVRLTRRLPSARLVGTACLPKWSLRFHKRSEDGSGKCSIIDGNDDAHFAVFEISVEDKLALDEIEGVGNGYSGISLSIPGLGGCVSYIAEETHVDDSLLPYDWYRELVLAGARYHGFPDHYVAEIEMIRALPDPDSERGARQWEIVDLVRSGT